ncbi:hypothetical protein [uncultured Arcticibacterium sp.]|uniref:hypothetical protein n=1 Tax=uncultured Arcticibacterium sp. TaxID=2173042 RepID=UPI0030F92E2F
MRFIHLFLTTLVLSVIISLIVLLECKSAEGQLLGDWDEVTWEYENSNTDDRMIDFEISQGQRSETFEKLIIYGGESWRFTNDYKMKLRLQDGSYEDVKWKVKGRGNVLELEHENLGSEKYQIQKISEDNLVIHFSSDAQHTGVVKMTLKRKLGKVYAKR